MSTNISSYLKALSKSARSHLRIMNQTQLEDERIDQALRESGAVLAPYRRVTQSAVVPVAFMHGTPVISTREGGLPESVIEGKTGYLLDVNASYTEWEARFGLVRSNFVNLSSECRQFYLDHHDAKRVPDLLRPVLESVGVNS